MKCKHCAKEFKPKNPVHRLACGDSTDKETVERLMAGKKADCMWTDAPYGLAYIGKTKNALTIENDTPEGLPELLRLAFGLADSIVLREGAAIYAAHPAGALHMEFDRSFVALGWPIRQVLVWVKDSMVLGRSDYHYRHESILYALKPGGERRGRGTDGWHGDNCQTSVFDIPRPKRSEEHPTMKPVALVAAMISNSCSPGGLVYDPFLGSGTTALAAAQCGMSSAGCEIDPKYVAVCIERLSLLGLRATLQDEETLRLAVPERKKTSRVAAQAAI